MHLYITIICDVILLMDVILYLLNLLIIKKFKQGDLLNSNTKTIHVFNSFLTDRSYFAQ